MPEFDTQVQLIKYTILREVAKHMIKYGTEDFSNAFSRFDEIAAEIVKDKPTMRCCIYKERAIVNQRIKLAIGGNKNNPNVIEIVDIACDECPAGGYTATDSCRGCIAHRCASVCKVGAISFDENQKCVIDKNKCVNCGRCASVCPYDAIINRRRPCEKACKIGAIDRDRETNAAKIDNDKCIACGACVYQCPFGAINDKSYICNAIDILKRSKSNKEFNAYAVVAPSIASQFEGDKLGKVIAAISELGFKEVFEAALGADMVSLLESKELSEKEFLTSSCCPAFVRYIETAFPSLKDNISHNLSPMAQLGKAIKEKDPSSKVIFIGPCTAKKAEIQLEKARKYIDCVLTFEELQALIDAYEIDVDSLSPKELSDSTYFGRVFARSGGVSEAVAKAAEEQGLDLEVNSAMCNGISECKTALLKASKGVLKNNFIEGMACDGGCVGGAGCLTHYQSNGALKINKHANEKNDISITKAVEDFDL